MNDRGKDGRESGGKVRLVVEGERDIWGREGIGGKGNERE